MEVLGACEHGRCRRVLVVSIVALVVSPTAVGRRLVRELRMDVEHRTVPECLQRGEDSRVVAVGLAQAEVVAQVEIGVALGVV